MEQILSVVMDQTILNVNMIYLVFEFIVYADKFSV